MIDYWANQDPDGEKKKVAEAKRKADLEKATKEAEEVEMQSRME